MDLTTVRTFYRYSDWANERMLSAIQQLTPEQITHEFSGSFRSIRDTFAHIVVAEWLWLQRWKGDMPTALPDWAPTADIARLADQMQRTARERSERLARLSAAELEQPFRARNLKGDVTWELPLGMMLLHVANHSTYHRGQVASLIRQAGGAPTPTDLLIFATQ